MLTLLVIENSDDIRLKYFWYRIQVELMQVWGKIQLKDFSLKIMKS